MGGAFLSLRLLYKMASKSSGLPTRGKVHALLTGPPGIGKTTLVRKVCSLLQQKEGIAVHGFYTEEVRERTSGGRGSRIGFDVVTLSGDRAPLARVGSAIGTSKHKPAFVGKYRVELESFESTALPTLQLSQSTPPPSDAATSQGSSSSRRLFVIDEIGKMELFSSNFVKCVQSLFKAHPPPPPPGFEQEGSRESMVVLATIPIARQRSHWLVEELRHREDCLLFEVSERNRDSLVTEVSDFLIQNLTK